MPTYRKRANAGAEIPALDEAARYRILVEAVTDYAIYMLDPEGAVTSWNAGAQRIKGYTPDEIIGQNFSRFYTEEDRAQGMPERVLAISAREGKFEGEGWRVRKDGSRFWAHVVIDPIRDSRRRSDRLRQDHPRHHRAQAGAGRRWTGRARRCSSPRRWKRWAS